MLNQIRAFLSKIIRINQDFSALSDNELVIGYWDTVGYVVSFKDGREKTVNPELSKEKALAKYEATISILERELEKRGIDKGSIQIIYDSDEGRFPTYIKK
ncbi:hypothetical protein ABHN11_13370 [Brevibacillus centrosporus]|jgi:hypothetical protein|uniref:hypothetical protein n=1 Tax=Brevibacillus centrosporus TaxID=54910 RepID=UPI0039888003